MLFHSHCLCTSEQYLLRPSLVSILRRRATTLSDIDYSATAKNPDSQFYPFPKAPRPTPLEIFHLPIGASSADVKSRCQSSAHISIKLDNRWSQIMNLSDNTIPTHLAHEHTHHALMSETLVSKPSALPIAFCKTLLVEQMRQEVLIHTWPKFTVDVVPHRTHNIWNSEDKLWKTSNGSMNEMNGPNQRVDLGNGWWLVWELLRYWEDCIPVSSFFRFVLREHIEMHWLI